MPLLQRTFTRTYNAVRFADPYKRCLTCGQWVDGYLDKPGPVMVIPCEHEANYEDVCPSWGPVDGCTCPPGSHPVRPRNGDDRTY